MKVLIIGSSTVSWGYIPELIEQLRKSGLETDFFNIDIISKSRFPSLVKMILTIPKLRTYFRLFVLRRRLSRVASHYDVVNIHFIDPIYSSLIKTIKTKALRVVATVWGSEFLKASPQNLQKLFFTISRADLVSNNNQEILDGLAQAFPQIGSRFRLLRFGLKSLESMRKVSGEYGLADLKSELGIGQGKLVVSVGYNAIAAQQHQKIIDALKMLSASEKSKLCIIFPMTYPNDEDYKTQIRQRMEESGLEFKIFDKNMEQDDIAKLRLVSDVCINAQITDSLSASIQEYMFAGNLMLIGAWLPYGIFEKAGAEMIKFSDCNEITALLSQRIESLLPHSTNRKLNVEIYRISSWEANVRNWIESYKA